MQVVAANGLATLSYLGAELGRARRAADAGDAGAAPVAAALAAAVRTQDRMIGALLEAVDRPWLDTPFERRERLRRLAAHEAYLAAL